MCRGQLEVSLWLVLKLKNVFWRQLLPPHLDLEHCRYMLYISNSRHLEVRQPWILGSVKTFFGQGTKTYHHLSPTNWRLGHIADALQGRLAVEHVIQEHPGDHRS